MNRYHFNTIRQVLAALALFMLTSLSAQAAPYFTNKEGNLIWDKATGLVWMRCSVGQTWDGETCTGDIAKIKYSAVQSIVNEINLRGYAGYSMEFKWMLPNIRQLASLIACQNSQLIDKVDVGDDKPPVMQKCSSWGGQATIDSLAFPNTPYHGGADSPKFRSSSLDIRRDNVWYVDFRAGNVYSHFKSWDAHIRLVSDTSISKDELEKIFSTQVLPESLWAIEISEIEKKEQRYFTNKTGDLIWDRATELVWMRCSLGQKWEKGMCAGDAHAFDQKAALAEISRMNGDGGYASFSDWQLPSISQYLTLAHCVTDDFRSSISLQNGTRVKHLCPYDEKSDPPAINTAVFPFDRTGSLFWSRTMLRTNSAYLFNTYDAGVVDFGIQSSGNGAGRQFSVRPVRKTKISGADAALLFSQPLPSWNKLMADLKMKQRKAESERAEAARIAEVRRVDAERKDRAAREVALKALVASGSQNLYLEAGKAQRNGSVLHNGQSFYASELYELIIEKFPKSEFAVKASDQLNASNRAESSARQQDYQRNASRQQCEAQKQSCLASCPPRAEGFKLDSSARTQCVLQCERISCN